jgi:hypothetical protein
MITFILVTRNDSYSGLPIDRLKISLKHNISLIKRMFPTTYNDFEILIVDWGSEDKITKEILGINDFNLKIYFFPKEITEMFDSSFNEVHSLNFLIRKSNNNFVARLDQDILIGDEFFEFLKSNTLRDDVFYWSVRIDLIDGVITPNYNALPWKISGENFHKGAIGIILSNKKNWTSIKGYNENYIYRNHMEHDLYDRFYNLLGNDSCLNLGELLNVPFFHLYHDRHNLSEIKQNELNWNFNNSENWGLFDYEHLIKIIE